MKNARWGWWAIASLRVWVGIAGAEEITLNRTATFTNLEGRSFKGVQLTVADWDGVIWRQGASGGRVCYTNLDPNLLQAWGVPTNRIAIARARVERRAAAEAQNRLRDRRSAQADATLRAKVAAEQAAAAIRKDRADRKQAEADAIENLAGQIQEAKLLLRRAKAAAHDFNEANRYNRLAPTLYVKDSERVKVEEMELQLKRMKAAFADRYGEKIK